MEGAGHRDQIGLRRPPSKQALGQKGFCSHTMLWDPCPTIGTAIVSFCHCQPHVQSPGKKVIGPWDLPSGSQLPRFLTRVRRGLAALDVCPS